MRSNCQGEENNKSCFEVGGTHRIRLSEVLKRLVAEEFHCQRNSENLIKINSILVKFVLC
jgi:hypothetical protein